MQYLGVKVLNIQNRACANIRTTNEVNTKCPANCIQAWNWLCPLSVDLGIQSYIYFTNIHSLPGSGASQSWVILSDVNLRRGSRRQDYDDIEDK